MLFSLLRCTRNALQITAPFLRTPTKSACIASWNVLKNRSILQEQISKSFHFQSFNKCVVNIPKHSECSALQSNIYRARPNLLQPSNLDQIQKRTVTKFSWRKGKRKTVKVVLKKFKRLDWGVWIHGKCGRQKRLYRKSANQKRRLRQHVFCNGTQSWLLDSMVTNFWRKPKHYVEDPYKPYHSREEFHITRKKPIKPVA